MRWMIGLLLMVGCGEMVDEDRAVKTAEANGFTQVRVAKQHGLAPGLYGCAKDDAVAFDVEGTNVAGKRAQMTVCCGLVLKGCTIRH